jgi:transcriptional regulator with XRE-family HTH domain
VYRLVAKTFRVELNRLLAETLRRARQDAALTQAQMARKLGISRPTLTRLENADQNVTLKTVSRLCRALRCDPGDLFRPGSLRPRTPRAKLRRDLSAQADLDA